MSAKGKHIIQKLNVDVDVNSIQAARRLYADMPAFIRDVLIPAIEAELNKFPAGEDVHWQADALTLDIDVPAEAVLEQDAPALVAQSLSQAMRNKAASFVTAAGDEQALHEWPLRAETEAAIQTAKQEAAERPQPAKPFTPGQPDDHHSSYPGLEQQQQTGLLQQTPYNRQPPQPYAVKPDEGRQSGKQPDSIGKKQRLQDAENQPAQEQANPAADETARLVKEAEKIKSVFAWFLQTGRLPWYAGSVSGTLHETLLLNQVLTDEAWVRAVLKPLLDRSPISIRRLILQFSETFVWETLAALTRLPAGPLQEYTGRIKAKMPPQTQETFRQSFQAMLLQAAARDFKLSPQQIHFYIHILLRHFQADESLTAGFTVDDLFFSINGTGAVHATATQIAEAGVMAPATEAKAAAITGHTAAPANEAGITPPAPAVKKSSGGSEAETGIHVSNCGLAVLHPYFEELFSKCGLLENREFKNNQARQTAVCLLHYLATGNVPVENTSLRFEQYLCAAPQAPVVLLPAAMLAEADKILNDAAHRMERCKIENTGALREERLQWKGILMLQAVRQHLIIYSGEDVVVRECVPWSFRSVQLPWMPKALHISLEHEMIAENPFLQTRQAAAAQQEPEREEGIYVLNGGLVILHPFLEYFFRECDLLNGSRFKNATAAETAVHLLYYLATGKEQPFECDVLFEKYLCGLADGAPVNRFISLTENMKTECEQLLGAAISHWKALKNTSADGLRQGFLQREAKLMVNSAGHKLLVAPNTVDILLQQLPWGVSIIHLPWMPQLLHVEWNNG